MKTSVRILVLSVLAVLLLSACGGTASQTAGPSSSRTPAKAKPTPTEQYKQLSLDFRNGLGFPQRTTIVFDRPFASEPLPCQSYDIPVGRYLLSFSITLTNTGDRVGTVVSPEVRITPNGPIPTELKLEYFGKCSDSPITTFEHVEPNQPFTIRGVFVVDAWQMTNPQTSFVFGATPELLDELVPGGIPNQ